MVDIVSISVYSNNTRVKLCPDSEGKFLIPNYSRTGSPLRKVSAVDLVTNAQMKKMDPVLSLSDGTKMRVYQGGDPTGLITMAISLCEKHDKKHKKKIPVYTKPKSRNKKVIRFIEDCQDSNAIEDDYLDDCFDYPWSDPALYDDTD